jgi:hypothetical protein
VTRGIPVTVESEVAVAPASAFATIVPIPLETIFRGFGNRTQVRWTYVFRPRMGRSALVRAAIAPLWKRYQWRALMLALGEAAKLAI